MIKEGILIFRKPSGITSNDCIYRMRRATGLRKIGHTGTLDPMAEGVLPLCIGSAARITEYLDLDFKSYRCSMLLGIVTDTLDTQGEILEDKRAELAKAFREGKGFAESDVRAAFSPMKGYIEQLPPKYSAVRVAGRRLYDYARAGDEVEIKPRRVYIRSIENIACDFENPEELKLTFDVVCSKGTYIRTICHDVGAALGCGAAMCALTRTASGRFSIDEAVSAEELARITELPPEEREAAINALLVGPDYPLTHFGKVVVSYETGRKFCDGWHLSLRDAKVTREPEFAGGGGELDMRPEYREAYNVYMRVAAADNAALAASEAVAENRASKEASVNQEQEIFLGVAFYNHRYKKLVADKIFYKGFLKNENIQQS